MKGVKDESKLERRRNEDREGLVVSGEQEASICLGPRWNQRTDVLRGQDFLNLWPESWLCLRNRPILGVTSGVGVETEWRTVVLEMDAHKAWRSPGWAEVLVFPQQTLAEHPLCVQPRSRPLR